MLSSAKGDDPGQQHRDNPSASPASSDAQRNSKSSSEQSEFISKSRRLVRACDECRGRKIKCDGRQPCLHCISVGLDCTYDQPRKRSTRLSYKEIEELRSRLERAQNLLKAIAPDFDLENPNLDIETLKKLRISTNEELSIRTGVGPSNAPLQEFQYTAAEQDVPLETVLETTGRLDLDDQGNWSYHGHGSSSAFMRRIGEQFENVSDSGLGKNTVLRLRSISQDYESPRNSEEQLFNGSTLDFITLPQRDVALDLISSALNDACAILNFVHQPSFYSMFERVYLVEATQYTHEEKKFLPLLYAVFAVGYLFSNSDRAQFGYAHAVSEGEKYFAASQRMLDITECHDLWSLQALVFMTLFLHSSAKMSKCHSYLCAAMVASLQMGLHRCEPQALNPIEREIRKRIFWAIRTMETYVAAILGLPRSVRDDDIDQELPLEIDDQFITKEGILPMTDGRVSVITGFNAHTKLIEILGKVVTDVYPTKRMQKESTDKPRAYVVSDAKVREVEGDLQQWARNLPMQLRPGADSPRELLRVQHQLRLAFTHVQMVLYRPFVHYISSSRIETATSGQCFAYAAACVDVGRNVVYNAREMEKQGTFNGPYWFSIYTTFCATLSLVFYVWENADVQVTLQTLKDAEYGRDLLVKLAYKSMAAARHSETLAVIFNRLPERLGNIGRKQSNPQRKRHQSLSKEHEFRGIRGHPNNMDGADNSYGHPQQSLLPENLQYYVPAAKSVDSGESSSIKPSLIPQYFPNTPDTLSQGNFARYLGPNSIEDIFRLQPDSYSIDVAPPEFGSTSLNPSQRLDSLDQYVSMLDLQNLSDFSSDIFNNSVGDSISSSNYKGLDNAAMNIERNDGEIRPFIPLSPYIMRIPSLDGSQSLVGQAESYDALFGDDYFAGGRNGDDTQEEWFQELIPGA